MIPSFQNQSINSLCSSVLLFLSVFSEEEGERFLMLEEQKQNSITLPDNHDDITVSLYGRQNTACQGPKIVEIPSDDDDNDSDIGKSLPRLRQTVSKTQERQSQKRICIRIPPLPPESQSPTRQSTDFIPACQGQTDQLSLCCLNQPVVNQQALNEPSLNLMTLTETTLSQPTLSQTTLCQTAPVVSDAAFSMVSQGQEYLPADVKPTILELDNANVAEQVNTGFLEDLTPGKYSQTSFSKHCLFTSASVSDYFSNRLVKSLLSSKIYMEVRIAKFVICSSVSCELEYAWFKKW